MDFNILTDSARYDRKDYQTKCHDGNSICGAEINFFKEKVNYRNEDKELGKSSSNERHTQLFHFSEYLKRQLLNAGKHKARRKYHTQW